MDLNIQLEVEGDDRRPQEILNMRGPQAAKGAAILNWRHFQTWLSERGGPRVLICAENMLDESKMLWM